MTKCGPVATIARMKNLFFHFGHKPETHRPAAGATCDNCHAPVSTTFCGECGQKAKAHVASAHEFLHHFIGHYVAAEGKLWRTLGWLLFKPGQLTVEFIRGRRGQFIDPLRLLLTVSLLAFLVMKWELHHLESPAPAATAQVSAAAPATAAQAVDEIDRKLFNVFAKASDHFAVNYGRFLALPKETQDAQFFEAFLQFGPTVMLCLIPLMAGLLKLMHLGSGWRYGEHLVFAMHLQTLNLLALIIHIGRMSASSPVLKTAVVLYMLLAMRKVYGGGWVVLLLRTLALAICIGSGLDWLIRTAFMLRMV